MKRVLLIGLDPATVDFLDPALPPGMTAEKIHAGVNLALAVIGGAGIPRSASSTPRLGKVQSSGPRLRSDWRGCPPATRSWLRLPWSRINHLTRLISRDNIFLQRSEWLSRTRIRGCVRTSLMPARFRRMRRASVPAAGTMCGKPKRGAV